MSILNGAQAERYARNIVLKEIGGEGQQRLLKGSVLIIGAGGLGSSAALYLAASGVGKIGIADADTVSLSNLQRQIIHSTADIGRSKTESARESIEALNPDVRVETFNSRVSEQNIAGLIKDYDFIIDATDNFPSKFIINDACVEGGKPFVHAGVTRFFGQLLTYVPGMGPCMRCIFKEPPPPDVAAECGGEVGVMGAVPGLIGILQAMEATKYLSGAGRLLTGRLLSYDALRTEFRTVRLSDKTESCRVCKDVHGHGDA